MTKKLIGSDIGSYIFDPVAKTITIKGVDNLQLEQLSLITNVTDGVILYCPIKAGLTASINNNVITLVKDTTTMSSTDDLQIYVDVVGTEELLIGLTSQISLLADLVKSLANVDAFNRQVVTIGGAPAISGTVVIGAGAAAIGSLTATTAEIGKVTQTYSDSQMAGQIASNIAVQKFSF